MELWTLTWAIDTWGLEEIPAARLSRTDFSTDRAWNLTQQTMNNVMGSFPRFMLLGFQTTPHRYPRKTLLQSFPFQAEEKLYKILSSLRFLST